MRNAAIKLMVLSAILLVSISGIVLGYPNYPTNGTVNATGTPGATVDITGAPNATGEPNTTVDITGAPNATGEPNTTVNVTEVQGTVTSTPGDVVSTTKSTPKETVVTGEPVKTPKSPGFGSVVSAVALLLAMYIGKRK